MPMGMGRTAKGPRRTLTSLNPLEHGAGGKLAGVGGSWRVPAPSLAGLFCFIIA